MNPVEQKTPKEQLELLYPDLKHIRTKVKLDFPNCDVHLLRIPNSVDPLHLLNKEISLEEKSKIRLDEKYVIEATPRPPDPTLIVSDHSKILSPRKNFIMTKYLKVKKQREISVRENGNIKLPKNLKARHPLFGSMFEDKINLSEEVEKKLDEAIANVLKKKNKKEKKKQKRKIKQEQEDIQQNEVIYDLLNIHSISTARIKTEVSDDSAFSSYNSSRNPNEINGRDQDDSVMQALNNIKEELETTYETDVETQFCKRKKKKKRVKAQEQEVSASTLEEIKQDIDSLASPRRITANSTLLLDASRIPCFSPNLSSITTSISHAMKREKKLKRKLSHSQEHEINNGMNNFLNDINNEPSSSKKVKKKKRNRSLEF